MTINNLRNYSRFPVSCQYQGRGARRQGEKAKGSLNEATSALPVRGTKPEAIRFARAPASFSLCVKRADGGLWAAVQGKPHNGALAGSLLLAVFLFGANNTGIKFLVGFWPPLAIGASRFLLAGLVLLGLLRWTRLFGAGHTISPDLKRRLWWRTGLLMALYIVAFNYALKLTSISHVALYLGAAPVWALLWEGQPEKHWRSAQRYGAASPPSTGMTQNLICAGRVRAGGC
jgi:hypothetical protein